MRAVWGQCEWNLAAILTPISSNSAYFPIRIGLPLSRKWRENGRRERKRKSSGRKVADRVISKCIPDGGHERKTRERRTGDATCYFYRMGLGKMEIAFELPPLILKMEMYGSLDS
jgi:hypothetical protein